MPTDEILKTQDPIKRVLRSRFMIPSSALIKKDFENRLALSINAIKDKPSELASKVLDAIDSKQVKILSFYDLSQEHYLSVVSKHIDKENQHLIQYFPPNAQAVRVIEESLVGLCCMDTIYIKSGLSMHKMIKAIVHEVTHFLNLSLHNKELKTMPVLVARFYDELRAHSAEKLFLKQGVPLTDEEQTKVYRKVSERYEEYENITAKKIRI